MAGEQSIMSATGLADIPPVGAEFNGHRANGGRFTDVMMSGFNWERKQLPQPGAMNYAFDTLALSETTAIGPGIRQRQYWATVSVPVFFANQTAPNAGFGGVAHGQYIGQPLFDPYNNTYGNIQGG